MTGFTADWLALREPFDLAARAACWPDWASRSDGLRQRATGSASARFSVIDLASGTGANVRALAPRIGGWQHWQLLDHDPALLAEVPAAMALWARERGYRCRTDHGPDRVLCIDGPALRIDLVSRCVDLARDPGAIVLGQAHLVTACALLDLVSAPWVDAMLDRVRACGAAWWWALSVDGRIEWDPPDADDATVQRLFEAHQRRDKGFGPALGPAAVPYLRSRASAAGETVLQGRSDWVIDGAQGDAGAMAMLVALIAGVATAAIEQAPDAADRVRAWQARRLVVARHSRLVVGHLDIAFFP